MSGSFSDFADRFSLSLNAQQSEAAAAVAGPVLLLAVPGSGKTTVLVSRLGYMIYSCGIAPEKILTLTYTVAASKDMAERFVSFFGGEYADRVRFRTINGVCQSVINYYKNRVSTKEPFELETDEKMLSALTGSIYREITGEYPADADIRDLRTKITYAKNMMLSEKEIKKQDTASLPFSEIYKAYNEELKRRRLMDYDDQMVYALKILKSFPAVSDYYRGLFEYICVDEAQDTSKIQHEIIYLLAGEKKNVFMVGDEDQSIYGFRAAYPEALLDFEKTYPGAKVLFIEENFRSDANIVNLADGFIKLNKGRRNKSLRPSHPAENNVRLVKMPSPASQYAYLIKAAQNISCRTAVLYKDNETALPLIDMLERENIPYNVRKSDFVFFSSRTVRDIRDIFNFARDMTDGDCFLRFYARLGLFIKKDTVKAACLRAAASGRDVFTCLMQSDISQSMSYRLSELKRQFSLLWQLRPSAALDRIVDRMGYGDQLNHAQELRRINILEILARRTDTVEGFLDRLDELDEIIKNKGYDKDCLLCLSTIHSAKGLEFDSVYLADIYNGVLPEKAPLPSIKRKPADEAALEEERRLFYVGVTRAKKKLTVFGFSSVNSTFIKELFNIRSY